MFIVELGWDGKAELNQNDVMGILGCGLVSSGSL